MSPFSRCSTRRPQCSILWSFSFQSQSASSSESPSEFADGGCSSSESADVDFGLFLPSKLVLVLVSVVGSVGVECRSVGGVLV